MSWRGVLGGKPIVRGTRISVGLIIGWLAAGETPRQIIDDYPVLTEEDIAASAASAREAREQANTWTRLRLACAEIPPRCEPLPLPPPPRHPE